MHRESNPNYAKGVVDDCYGYPHTTPGIKNPVLRLQIVAEITFSTSQVLLTVPELQNSGLGLTSPRANAHPFPFPKTEVSTRFSLST